MHFFKLCKLIRLLCYVDLFVYVSCIQMGESMNPKRERERERQTRLHTD